MIRRGPRHFRKAAVLVGLLWVAILCSGCGESRDLEELRRLIDQGRQAEAVPSIEALLDENPDDLELNRLYGLALFTGGNPSLALWPLNKLLESGEATPEDYVVTASAHLKGGSPTEAVEVATEILDQYPDLLQALDIRIAANRQLNKMDEALEDVEFILERRPDEFQHHISRLELLFAIERPEEEIEAAIVRAKAAMDDSALAEDWQVRFCALDASFGFEREEEGRVEKAGELWDGCLVEYPAEPLIVNESVAFYDGLGKFARSREILEVAMEAAPQVAEFRFSLAAKLNAAGEVELAENLIEEFPEEALGGAAAWQLVDYYVSRDDYPMAVVMFQKVLSGLEVDQETGEAVVPEALRLEYVDLLIRAGDFELAEAELAFLEKPEFENMMRGRLALSRNDPEEALTYLDEAIRFWPGNSVARQLAAEAAERAGQFDRARGEYLEAVRSGPDNLEALEKLAKIYEAMGDVGALSQLLGLYIDGNLENPRGYELQFEVGIWSGNPKMAASAVEGLYLVPGREPMALALAARYNGMGQPAKSVEFIRASGVDLTEASLAPVLDVMVENLIASGQVDAALEQASVALEKTPLYWKLHEIQGRALLAYDSKLAEAQLAFEEALRLNPRNPEALKGLAVSLSRQGQVDEALVLYRQAGEIDWLSPEAEWAAIDLLTEKGRIGERDALLEILVQEHGEDARGAALLAQRLLDEGGDLVRARGLAERAVEMRGGESAQAVLSQIEARESGPGQGSTEG